ncbi:hypothetical protein BDK51DRAFT_36647 [Blyttiomyces helicus]|uniref:C3H1-type domain-containing protein n=1 Tax=Blyttiomyces helicus TaxID=388810 RepID=A0A4P9VXC8_9FUNG|nr:hypothetical protein BDK51DRAFT_36647 [Blyttiomyces helicus]|eukprot:RKO84381.1 hypothetical protein BDK51DRAFT_36647 [Blyttiomyces helicus]
MDTSKVGCRNFVKLHRKPRSDSLSPYALTFFSSTQSCPICREVTHFVVPSATWIEDPEQKARIVEEYKTKLGAIDCKHYNFGDGSCPFGTSCFYRHMTRDGNLEEVRLRVVKADEEDVRIVSSVKLSDYLGSYEDSRRG